MYLFELPESVIKPSVTIRGVDYPAGTALWGPRLQGGNGTMAPLALAAPSDACSPMTVDLTGKIAVADPTGPCDWNVMVRHRAWAARQAGIQPRARGVGPTARHYGRQPA